jgi:hypothetical protein
VYFDGALAKHKGAKNTRMRNMHYLLTWQFCPVWVEWPLPKAAVRLLFYDIKCITYQNDAWPMVYSVYQTNHWYMQSCTSFPFISRNFWSPPWTQGFFKVINIYLHNDFDLQLSDWCLACFKPWGIQWTPLPLSLCHDWFLNKIKAVTASQKVHFFGIWILLGQCLHHSRSRSVRGIGFNIAYKNI